MLTETVNSSAAHRQTRALTFLRLGQDTARVVLATRSLVEQLLYSMVSSTRNGSHSKSSSYTDTLQIFRGVHPQSNSLRSRGHVLSLQKPPLSETNFDRSTALCMRTHREMALHFFPSKLRILVAASRAPARCFLRLRPASQQRAAKLLLAPFSAPLPPPATRD